MDIIGIIIFGSTGICGACAIFLAFMPKTKSFADKPLISILFLLHIAIIIGVLVHIKMSGG